jgi:hypothetical protein
LVVHYLADKGGLADPIRAIEVHRPAVCQRRAQEILLFVPIHKNRYRAGEDVGWLRARPDAVPDPLSRWRDAE